MARPHFHEELEAIELEILGMGELAEREELDLHVLQLLVEVRPGHQPNLPVT